MNKINGAAAAGIVFFSIVLAGFVGIKVDQTTIALLGGAFIGLAVAIPTTVLIIAIGMKPRDVEQPHTASSAPPVFPQQQQLPATHNHYHDHKYVVIVNVPAGADNVLQRWTVAREMRVAPSEAQRMIDAGEVRCLPAGK